MLKYYAKQVLSAFLLVLAVVIVTFLLFEIAPGDPIQSMIGKAPVTEEFRQQLTQQYGLDRPFFERLFQYVVNMFSGNLGYSFANSRPVLDLIIERLGNTLILTIPSLIIAGILGILIGSASARTRSKLLDGTLSYFSVAALSMPTFWLGLLLILVFSVNLGWLPSGGMNRYGHSGFSLAHIALPLVVLVINELAFNARIMRSSMLEVLGQDYIDTARSKGLSRRLIVRRHATLNSMLPMVTVMGFSLGYTIAGAVITERVFSWPGMGLLLFDSIQKSENQIVVGILVVTTVTVVLANLLTDIVYGLVDPRIRKRFRQEREA